MRCEDALRLLPPYLANGLEKDDIAALSRHLEGCEGCATALLSERHLDTLITKAVDAATPPAIGLQERVRRQIESTPAPRRMVMWTRLAYAAVFLLAIGVGWRVWSSDARRMHLLCADAADDHLTEVSQHAHVRWRTTVPEIQALARQYIGPVELPVAVESVQQQPLALSRARICRLQGMRFLHLVYSDGGSHEVSVFLATADDDSGRWEGVPAHHATDVHQELDGRVEVSAVRSADITVVVASDENNKATKQIASELAQKM